MKTHNEEQAPKKAYSKPTFKEWGTLTTVTHGTQSGLEDDPNPGGSGTGFAPPWTQK